MNNNSHQYGDMDYYEILGVKETASVNEIRKAYLRQSLKVHPDKHPEQKDRVKANEAFVRLKAAYDVLYDASQRSIYDLTRRNKSQYTSNTRREPPPPPPPPPPQSSSTYQQWQRTRRREQDANAKYKTRASREKPANSSYDGHRRTHFPKQPQQPSQKRANPTSGSRPQYPFGSSSDKDYSPRPESRTPPPSSRQRRNDRAQNNSSKQYKHKPSPSPQHPRTSPRACRTKTFGKTASGGYCKRCIAQGCYCYQHTGQDPSCTRTKEKDGPTFSKSAHQQKEYPGSKHHPHHGDKAGPGGGRIYGVNKSNGKPCKRCQNQGSFCYHHRDQDLKGSTAEGNGRDSTPPRKRNTTKVFGRRKDGAPCARCQQQGRFCYQHVAQQ